MYRKFINSNDLEKLISDIEKEISMNEIELPKLCVQSSLSGLLEANRMEERITTQHNIVEQLKEFITKFSWNY